MTHAEAREIIRRAWRRVHGRDPSERELVYAQAIAALETGYGRSGQFAAMAARGRYNWGALQRPRNSDGSCPSGTEPGFDVGAKCFLVFDSDEEAAAEFLRLLTTRHWPVVQAMRGSPEDVATAMRVRPAYYEGLGGSEQDRISYYARAIRNAAAAAGSNLQGASAAIPGAVPWASLGLLAVGTYLWMTATKSGRKFRARLPRFS